MDEQKIESADFDEEEEFYEKIEAPKFVDFTKPYNFRTDDRYWFCSRVGCDQKHEQEINHEEISKNFVLRVMAARSPNIKLRKALNKDHSRLKCPLSAPAKASKPRIPRLPMLSHLSSDKINNGDPQSKTHKTPVMKSRPVAAKYMTTPRNKMCRPNPNSFRSVQNPKATTIDVPKAQTIAKALVFHSPKKAICVKKSVELHTPLKKICQGMKRLEIGSQKKILKGTKTKPKKTETEDTSARQLKSDKKLAASKSTKKAQNKKIPSSKVVENESGEMDVDVKLIDGCTPEIKEQEVLLQQETSDSSNALLLRTETNNSPNVEDKENMAIDVKLIDGSTSDFIKIEEDQKPQANSDTSNLDVGNAEDHSNEVVAGQVDDYEDGKENASNHADNNRFDNQPLSDKNLTKGVHTKNKVVQTSSGPAGGMKCKKPKPTNIKPFRLRTDERGILREALMEKKLHGTAPGKDVLKDTSVLKRTYRVPVTKIENSGKETSSAGSKPVAKTTQKRTESTHQRPRYMTSLRTRSPQGIASPEKTRTPFQQLDVIKEKSCRLTGDVVMAEIKSRATSATRSTSQGKRPLTIAKEPNFHTSHRPRACSKNIAS